MLYVTINENKEKLYIFLQKINHSCV